MNSFLSCFEGVSELVWRQMFQKGGENLKNVPAYHALRETFYSKQGGNRVEVWNREVIRRQLLSWLAGPESDALPHDKTRGFGMVRPAPRSPPDLYRSSLRPFRIDVQYMPISRGQHIGAGPRRCLMRLGRMRHVDDLAARRALES
jgi:hypothetical protein